MRVMTSDNLRGKYACPNLRVCPILKKCPEFREEMVDCYPITKKKTEGKRHYSCTHLKDGAGCAIIEQLNLTAEIIPDMDLMFKEVNRITGRQY